MSKICPFMSKYAESTKCAEDRCMLWGAGECVFTRGIKLLALDIIERPQREERISELVAAKITGHLREHDDKQKEKIETQAEMNEKANEIYREAYIKLSNARADIVEILSSAEQVHFLKSHDFWAESVAQEQELIKIKYAGGSILPLELNMHGARRFDERTREYEKMLEERKDE